MFPTRQVAGIAVVAVLACGIAVFAAQAKSVKSDKTTLERGRYLVTIMGCGDCHTPGSFYGAPDRTRMLSGSEMGWEGPWGVVYASNLTPHATGLGAWTDQQIIQAIRTGNRPDGRQLAPAMPWMGFSALTDGDAQAIVAYLRSLTPVEHRVPSPVPPGTKPEGPVLAFPPPSAWDAPRTPPEGSR